MARAILAALALAAASRAAPSNVLLLAVDDLRPEIGAFGGAAHTPNLDALAAASVVFDHASVQLAVCNPSRSSFMTGRRIDSLRVYDLATCWRTGGGVNATTMPQHFKSHGFVTGGSGKIFHPVWNNHTDTTDDVPYSWDLPYYHPPRASDIKYSNLTMSMWPVPPSQGGAADMPDGFITANAVQMLRNVTTQPGLKGKPFLVAMGLHRPHLPWTAPDHFWDLYPIENVAMPAWPYRPHGYTGTSRSLGFDPQSGPRHCKDVQALNVSFPMGYIPLEFGRKMKQAYLAATSFADSQMGLILQELQDSGAFENTTIVFLGDHGWQLGEHGEYGKKTNWDRSTTAPLMIKPAGAALPAGVSFAPAFADRGSGYRHRMAVDGSAAGPHAAAAALTARLEALAANVTRSSAFVEFAAIYPTVAELSGIPVPGVCPPGRAGLTNTTCVEGTSFAGAVRLARAGSPVGPGEGKGGAPTAAFAQYPHCMHDVNEPGYFGCRDPSLPGQQPRFMGYTILAVEAGREWRYTRWMPFDLKAAAPNWAEALGEELYDRTADPEEDTDVIGDPANAAVIQTLAARLQAGWRGALSQ